MKQITLLLFVTMPAAIGFAQAPLLLNYQGVARNGSGVPYANQSIMKKLALLSSMIILAFFTNAQSVAVNTDGTTAHGSSIFEVKSINKGLLIPRMTSAQRSAIVSPALGLLVFDTDTKTIWAYNGIIWSNLTSTGGGGSMTFPFAQTVSLPGVAFSITNTSTAIYGASSNISTAALNGSNNSTGGMGVFGSSSAATGIGVIGQSGIGTGVFGNSPDGVGVKASSTNGLALQVNGNLKIAGGNTNPSNGAVLTSDAGGNAVWKANRVAFRGFDINNSYMTIPWGATQQIYYAYENYDLSSGFTAFESGTKPTNASAFSIPVDGIYHFEATADLFYDTDDFDAHATIYLQLNRNGVISTLGYYTGSKSPVQYPAFQTGTFYFLKASGDFLLFPGDKVYVEVSQFNDDNATAKIVDGPLYAFTGHLVVAY